MKKIPCLIFIFFLFIDLAFCAQEEFTFEFKEKGIVVYSKNISGSNIKEFYSSTVLNGNIRDIVHIINDFSSYNRLFPDVYYSELVESNDAFDIYYQIIDDNFFLKKRELFVEKKIFYDNDLIVIRFNAISHKKYPVTKAYFRITNLYGEWILTDYMSGQKTIVLYRIKRDLAGYLPDFILNRINKSHAFNILYFLKEYLYSTGK